MLYIIISPICFHLKHWESGKCNRSSEEHLRNLKTSRASYLDIELFFFVKKFDPVPLKQTDVVNLSSYLEYNMLLT